MSNQSMQKLNTIFKILTNSIVTIPSLIYHTVWNKYRAHINAHQVSGYSYSSNVLQNVHIIMFIHGRNGSPSDFDPLIENIKKHSLLSCTNNIIVNNDITYILETVDLGETANSSIDDDSEILKLKLKFYQDCQITLVGLSKGGLCAMRYATKENDPRIKKVITLSSPVKGTMTASLFPSNSSIYQNLGYQSPIIKQIDNDRKLKCIDIYHVVPKWDQLIIPSDAAKYDDVDESKIYYYNGCAYSHSGIQYSEDVCLAIMGWLQ